MKKRAEKVQNVSELAWKLMEKGAYVISSHAYVRKNERRLSIGDIQSVLKTGYHEKRKDEYKEEFADWNYAIILDSAVQDAKAMQDFESESLLMGVEHSQKVKATPIKSDYGSKDCVDLASSTAESRIIRKNPR